MYTFEEVLARLPECNRYNTESPPPSGINYHEKNVTNFVAPNLSGTDLSPDPLTTQVIVISAPGAVGKSTLAKAIAHDKGALLWDLATGGDVGVNSLDGILFEMLGGIQLHGYFQGVDNGEQFMIIDALDEGRYKVRENPFRLMLENVARRSRNSPGISFILLGRTKIAEEAWIVLDDNGVEASMVSIEPFDETQAREYIKLHTDPAKRTPVYDECRDLIFRQLASSIQDDDESISSYDFLHYPPVLDVITTLLNQESNPMELKNNLARGSTGTAKRQLEVLQEVIDHLLVREQEKLARPLAETFESLNPNEIPPPMDRLYAAEEQCKRLLSDVFDTNVDATPEGLSGTLAVAYEDVVNQALLMHPFTQGVGQFANSVFRSYLHALALDGSAGGELREKATSELSKKDYTPTRLLAEFYLNAQQRNNERSFYIRPDHLGIIYEAFASSESARYHVRLNIDGVNPIYDDTPDVQESTLAEVDIEFWPTAGEHQRPMQTISLTMEVDEQAVIRFPSQLHDAFITVPCSVKLGDNSDEFQIGPAVHIVAKEIRFDANGLVVHGRSMWGSQDPANDVVILEAAACDATRIVNRPILYQDDSLFVSLPGDQGFPWRNYAKAMAPPEFGDDETLRRVFNRFRRIVTEFRAHSNGPLSRIAQKIQNGRILQGPIGDRMLAKLTDDGILVARGGGSRYFWDSDKADHLLQVSYNHIRRAECPPVLRRYLVDFITQNNDLF